MKVWLTLFIVVLFANSSAIACAIETNDRIFNYSFEKVYKIESCVPEEITSSLVSLILKKQQGFRRSVLSSEVSVQSVVALLSRNAIELGGDGPVSLIVVQQIVDFYSTGPLSKKIEEIVLTSFGKKGLEVTSIIVFYDSFGQHAWVLEKKLYQEKNFYHLQTLSGGSPRRQKVPGPVW